MVTRSLCLLVLLALSASAQTPRIPPPESVNRNGLVGRWIVPGYQTGNGALPTRVLDLSPYKNNAINTDVIFGQENKRHSARFGSNKRLQVVPTSLSGPPLTFVFWINPLANQPPYAAVFTTRQINQTGPFFTGAGTTRLGYNWNNSTWSWSGTDPIPSNQWTFAALIIKTNSARYIISSPTGLKSYVNTATHSALNLGVTFYFGADPGFTRDLNGLIADFRIYSRELTPSEIANIYRGVQ